MTYTIFLLFFIEIVVVRYVFEVKNIIAVLLYLVIHFCVSILLAYILTPLFTKINNKNNKLKDKDKYFYIVFLFVFISSFVGMIFSIILAIYIIFKKEKFLNIETFVNSLEDNDVLPNVKSKLGMGALISFKEAHSVVKFNVLNYIRENNIKNKGHILKMAVSDDDDEIRLYAFSILSKEEDKLTKIMFENMQKLKEKFLSKREKNKIYRTLGIAYWEFLYLQLNDEQFKDYYLNMAKDNFLQAILNDENDYDSLFNLGRIYLQQKEINKAKDIFIRIYQWNKGKVTPYLAEIYFIEKEYEKVKELMKNLNLYEINSGFYFNYLLWSSK